MIQEKIIEIIVYLLGELRNNKRLSDIDYDNLKDMGYSSGEINSALSWIYNRVFQNEKIYGKENIENRSVRVLNDHEKNLITTDAYGYLLHLHSLGIINSNDLEAILEKITSSGFKKISVDEIKSVTADYLLELAENNNQNKIIINTKDSIN